MEVLITNPLDISEILTQVFGYVDNNTKDLLSCRLVNHRWNQIATNMLKKKDFVLQLDRSNLHSYVQLSKKSQLLNANVGINLNIEITRSCYQPKEGGNKYFKDLLNDCQILMGPCYNRVVEGIVDRSNIIDNNNFCQLIQLTSSTLKYLELKPDPKGKVSELMNETEEQDDVVDDGDEEESRYQITEPLQINVFSFPKLQVLKYKAFDIFETPSQSRAATRFITGFLPNFGISAALRHLDIPIYNGDSLSTLSQLSFPVLHCLKLHHKIRCLFTKSFCGFLANQTPCLDSLELYFLPISHSILGEERFELIQNKPLFQVLQVLHVGLYIELPYALMNDYSWSITVNCTIIAHHFPSLVRISSDVLSLSHMCGLGGKYSRGGIREYLPVALRQPPHIYSKPIFSNVNQLSINIYESCRLSHLTDRHRIDKDLNLNQLNKSLTSRLGAICPAITKLTFNHYNYELGNSTFSLDQRIAESGLKGLLKPSGITNLEINNCFGWISYLINTPKPTLSLLRSNLTHLKLGETSKTGNILNDSVPASCKISPAFLKNVLNYFPSLEFVEIEEKLIRGAKNCGGHEIPFDRVLNKLNGIRASYPHITVQLL